MALRWHGTIIVDKNTRTCDFAAMRLTTKGRYAVTAMLDLALHHESGPVTLGEIAKRQGISLSYLEQLFAQLRKRGLVQSTRGPGGGYRLGSAAEQIAIGDVIRAVDETVDATRCGGKQNCHDHGRCLTHDLWEDLSARIHDFLSDIDLAQLIEKHRGREAVLQRECIEVSLH
jgi:Rrf2 family transcriptional regulator, iron-sulfur cluster assembly transcription factor